MIYLLVSLPQGKQVSKEYFESFQEAWIEYQASLEAGEYPHLWQITADGSKPVSR